MDAARAIGMSEREGRETAARGGRDEGFSSWSAAVTLDNTQTAKSAKPNAKPIPSLQDTWHSAKAALHSAQAAMEQAQKVFDLAVIEARTTIAKLDEPWRVSGVARPMKEDKSAPMPLPVGNIRTRGPIGGRCVPETVITGRIFLGTLCLDPFYVAQERFCGEERRVVVYSRS
jgi:hypothetical protein